MYMTQIFKVPSILRFFSTRREAVYRPVIMRSAMVAVVLMSISCTSTDGAKDVGDLCDDLALAFCDGAKACGLLVPGEDETAAQIHTECQISGRNTCSRTVSSLDEFENPATCTSDLKNSSCTDIQGGLADHIRSCAPSDVDAGGGGLDAGLDAGNPLDAWCLRLGTDYCNTVDICENFMPTPDCDYNTYLQCLSNGAPNNEQLCSSGVNSYQTLCPLLDAGTMWPAACW